MFALTSCVGSKKLVTGNKTYAYANIINTFKANNTLPQTFSSKIGLSISGGETNMKLSGSLRMIKDSAVWISLSPGFGLEVARVLIRPDSFFVMNRLKSTAYIGSVNQMAALYGFKVQYRLLQAVILNSYNGSGYFELDKKLFKSFTAKDATDNLCFSGSKTYMEAYNLENFCLDTQTFKFTQLKLTDANNQKLALAYAGNQEASNVSLPEKLVLSLFTNNIQQAAELQFKKPVVNQKVKMSFKIPSKFDIITIKEKL